MDLLCDANACVAADLDPENYVHQFGHPPPNSASACALACRMDLLMIASLIVGLLQGLQRMTLSYLADASQPWDYFVTVPCRLRVSGRQGGEMSIGVLAD